MRPIKFGTDGWRGIISFDFTFPRTVLVAEAVRRYLAESGLSGQPLLIGYDNRFLADEFAANTANYLASAGQPVAVFSSPVPTPVCAFGVRLSGAAGALMFTASHNPYYYLGIKFIPDFAGPAEDATTERITCIIRDLETSGFAPPPLNVKWEGESVDVQEDYFKHLDTLVNASALNALQGKYLYAAFHGVGAGWVDKYLRERGVQVDTRFANRDVLFGNQLPDPSPANLQALHAEAADGGYALVLATDGDADRFGMMTADGTYFGGNETLPLLADYLLVVRGQSGELVRTVATSHMLDAVAVKHNARLTETPVGFKYVGRRLREGALIGGEESGGLSIAGHIPEKDGILSILLLLDLLAAAGATLPEVWQDFGEKYGHTGFERLDLELSSESKARLMTDVAILAGGDSFLERKIDRVITLDGFKFVFADASWVLLRPSGTEAIVRAYIEARDARAFSELRESLVNYLHEYATVK